MIQMEPLIPRTDLARCALCGNPPCDDACETVHPADLLRSVWFRNEQTAALRLPETNPCLTCRKTACELSCLRGGEVPIREIINRLYYQVKPECETAMPETEERLRTESLSELARALKKLPEQLMDIVILRYYDGKPLTEIAQIMGLSYGAVKLRHQNALMLLRTYMN